jgi:hypothetical protein
MKCAPVALLSIVVTGCVPWPHFANLTPGVAGDVTPGAELRLVALDGSNRTCEGRAKEFRANGQGDFYSPPIQSFSGVLVVMGHRLFPWALCIKEQDTWTVLHQDRTYTLVDTGPAFLVELSCQRAAAHWKCGATQNWTPSQELITALEKRNP